MPAKSTEYKIRLDKIKPAKETSIRKMLWIRVCKEIKKLAIQEDLDYNSLQKLKLLTDMFYKLKDDVRMDRVEEKEADEIQETQDVINTVESLLE